MLTNYSNSAYYGGGYSVENFVMKTLCLRHPQQSLQTVFCRTTQLELAVQ